MNSGSRRIASRNGSTDCSNCPSRIRALPRLLNANASRGYVAVHDRASSSALSQAWSASR